MTGSRGPEMLRIRGARHHNLRDIDVDMPKYRLVVVSGLSGSGKSTLAFDTIYAEGQRRYVESLSAYARQFLDVMDKPDVDSIEGLSPAISIQQKTTSKNPRSTVGTTTEIYDYMRLLFARVGTPHCPGCGRTISTRSADAICDAVLAGFSGTVTVLAPVIRRKKGTHERAIDAAKKDGYSRVRIDGKISKLSARPPRLEKQKWHNIELVVDRLEASRDERPRLFEAVQSAIKASGGSVLVAGGKKEEEFSQKNACTHCGLGVGELEPRNFSFNSPLGMCGSCNGLGVKLEFDPDLVIPDKSLSILEGAIVPWNGRFASLRKQSLAAVGHKFGFDLSTPIQDIAPEHLEVVLRGTEKEIDFKYRSSGGSSWRRKGSFEGVLGNLQRAFLDTESESKRERLRQFMRDVPCSACGGRRLRPEPLAVTVGGSGIMEVCMMPVTRCLGFFSDLKLEGGDRLIARDILREIVARLGFLEDVGLGYLTLDRGSATLSGGESQRIRLASQIGSNLTGVLYVLDEPTIGLHQRDNDRLIRTLARLRDLGNTVIVVEHDEEVIRRADWVIDLGPGAGVDGGRVVFEGTVGRLLGGAKSVTGPYLRDRSLMDLGEETRRGDGRIVVRGAAANNLRGIDVEIPLRVLVAVTGVSGSGKSTLVNDVLLRALRARFYDSTERPGKHRSIDGVRRIDKVISIDQSPIGRTPRSNPATYIGVFTPIRDLYASTQDARERGYAPGRFSFNVEEGRCFACDGDGVKRIEMQFLSDVYVTCDECGGKRYDSETLEVRYRGKNIADVLDMTAKEALEFFKNVPAIRRKLQTMDDVGLGYIRLGQSSTTLSGGEAQRVKLATELSKSGTTRTLYTLDEPTTGLHFADVKRLLDVLNRLVRRGNTVLVIEHNMDVIRNADWIIDLGPGGGEDGGSVVAAGTPEQVAASPDSLTGRYLGGLLDGGA
ncbi:MAG: excinuclease ABC subunit UvrA [Nitrosopumilus sp.]|nr:excinuclease ABC subunit UvrA [Nitrosopumilus sp.]MDA7943367.1 excinuclease ABC subunit UvrA [Nitrosopumilus sp.]MDA7999611.1 excinuclease ABC subunit UvrA [Nitrosopumilus sp.]